ncbi:hypothetical protein SteCoe_24844 [Stentor coeruleus]|uniref:EGF-like domain-containing protein n=1 Tax=Stentor coeruleus TaxID=5963 RepID=A0A1R2BGQ2_9CILI|nr:hypothetical protein SteCoe_24844 [Stentor coeruleus]
MWSLVLLSIGTLAITCPMYSCHEGGFDLTPVCGTVASDNIVLQICDGPSGSYCDVSGTITNNYTCVSGPPYVQNQAYPGEFCMVNSDCITNLCQSNKCIGQNVGYSCVSNADCTVGTYCTSGFYCALQVVSNVQCTNDYQCMNNMGCNNTLFSPGTCVPYYSLPIGAVVGNCVDMLTEGASNLCNSGACSLLNPGFDSLGICTEAFVTPTKVYPRICTEDSQCIGINSTGGSIIGACSCGMDMYGHAYCDSFLGDPPAQTLTQLWINHTTNPNIKNCHTQRRFDHFCLTQTLEPYQIQTFYESSDLATDTARYQNNDDCTKAIFNHQYWNYSPANFACKAYGCASPTQSWTGNTCVTFNEGSNIYNLNPCDSLSETNYCHLEIAQANKWSNVTCTVSPIDPPNYPGESCTNNTDCISNICVSGVCKGTAQGGSCTSSSQCNVGLYCISQNYMFTCQPLIGVNEYGCTSDYDCINTAGCLFNVTGEPGICTYYYSLAIGTPIICNSASGLNEFCQTGTCYSTGYSQYGNCTEAPVSKNPLGVPCTTNSQCTGTNSYNLPFQSTCTCGYNPNGNSYCQPFLGDPPGIAFMTFIKTFLGKSGPINLCQTTRRYSKDCYQIYANHTNTMFNVWYLDFLNFTSFPYLIDNDQCVKDMINVDFWSIPNPIHPKPVPLPPFINENITVHHSGSMMLAGLATLALAIFS